MGMKLSTEDRPRCLLSHPADPHTLTRLADKDHPLRSACVKCGNDQLCFAHEFHYYCTTCDVEFHYGCHQMPRMMTHPYHPQHPLHVVYINSSEEDEADSSTPTRTTSQSNISNPALPMEITFRSEFKTIFNKCSWCAQEVQKSFYCCLICNFCLDYSCAGNFPPPTIPNPKSHHHPLIFFPRPLLVPCDACGLVNASEPSYACIQCNYMVHESCIDLPRVIKITRHRHRLFHTPYLPPITSSCRICYKSVDIKYGQYSCNREDCSYVVHSKCATHKQVWDGMELEWEPEESEETEDLAPFKKVGDNLIKHFCHEHHLRLKKYQGDRDVNKQCQACILPIHSLSFYNCVECDYFLHEVCASLPRKLDHAVHIHSLFLDPSPLDHLNSINCSGCELFSSGFWYKCSVRDCEDCQLFKLDVRCILVPDYFSHKSHEHPLFISGPTGLLESVRCQCCKDDCYWSYLKCNSCEFAICYRCAIIPNEVYYKYDEHPLSLCYGEDSVDKYWCEVCEKEMDPTEWFYTCNKCCITAHRRCIFGSYVYLKDDYVFYYKSVKVDVVNNSRNTRPICTRCKIRCTDSVYFRSYKWSDKWYMVVSCSLFCFRRGLRD